MDYKFNCKTGYYKTPEGKHRQNSHWHKTQQYFLDPSPRKLELKTKISKWDLIKLKNFS